MRRGAVLVVGAGTVEREDACGGNPSRSASFTSATSPCSQSVLPALHGGEAGHQVGAAVPAHLQDEVGELAQDRRRRVRRPWRPAGSCPLAGSRFSGFGPVGVADTVTPARCRASMNAVRANDEGSSISCTTRRGALPFVDLTGDDEVPRRGLR